MLSPTVKRRVKKILLWFEILFIVTLGASIGIVLGAVYQMNKMLPEDAALDHYRPPVGTKIYSADGVLLAKLASENREPVKLSAVPKHMQQAIVAIEDSRFYSHRGLDYRSLARAVWANVTGGDLSSQGASTITQQLARNIFLSPRKTISRKIKEILLAVQIERNWTKNQILEAYLNQVYLGGGAYGIKSAAQTYFSKPLSKLTLPEAAMLAGLAQRPSRVSPYVAKEEDGNYDRTKSRRDMVLDRMAELKFITPQQARQAKAIPIKVDAEKPKSVGLFKAQYFARHVLDTLRDEMKYDPDYIETGGLTVYTTLNYKMQQAAENAALAGRDRLRRAHVTEAALICLDPHTGYIRAMVGGVNKPWEKYQFNCATQARRQPGSSFKMFVYGAALEQGSSVYSSVTAEAKPIHLPDGTWYEPKNHGRSRGGISFLSAFSNSVNGAAVNLCARVGPNRVKEFAERLGINSDIRAVPSLALGTSEVTLLEMASAYGVFPAKGLRATPIAITRILGPESEVLFSAKPQLTDVGLRRQTISGIDMLTRAVVTSGTGRSAGIVPDAHGKTGTTEDHTDAWFVGYTPDLVTAVWCGNRDNSHMWHVFGGDISAPIWARFMSQAVKLNPTRDPATIQAEKEARGKRLAKNSAGKGSDEPGEGKIRVRVCLDSGMRAQRGCPNTARQYFTPEERPTEYCALHRGRSRMERGERTERRERRRRVRRRRDREAPESQPVAATTDSPGVEAPAAAATDDQ